MFYLTTYATDPSKCTCLNAPRIVNLWERARRPWRDFKDKLHAMKEYLNGLQDEDIVCFTDAYDAIVFAGVDEMEAKFRSFEGVDVLFSAETSCFPWLHVENLYPASDTPYRYLNSGGYVGRVRALRVVFSFDMHESPCDQGYFTYVYINHLHDKNWTAKFQACRIRLDTACAFFQTAYAVPWSHFRFARGRLHNVHAKTTPAILHFNGQQFLTEDGTSVMPAVYGFARDESDDVHVLDAYRKKHPVVRFHDALASDVADAIREYAEAVAKKYVPPKQNVVRRDRFNHHAIFRGRSFLFAHSNPCTPVEQWEAQNRSIIKAYFDRIGVDLGRDVLLDISLHDFVGVRTNNKAYPHSVLGFSTLTSDDHNLLIPDLYAMQNYRNAAMQQDRIDTLDKLSVLHFIGNSTGTDDPDTNTRVRLCLLSKHKPWMRAYISQFVNIPEHKWTHDERLKGILHPHMSIQEQMKYRHIMIVDGNTACWDRLPWVFSSKCVPWKLESEHRCWYYAFMRPWVHYVPFTLDTLEATWERVRDDHALQLRIVRNANEFASRFLTPEAHALYAKTLLGAIGKREGGSTPATKDADVLEITWYCGERTLPWEGDDDDLRGSEQAVVHLSRAWAARGSRVRVYANCCERRTMDGVEYVPAGAFDASLEYETLILWRMPGAMPFLGEDAPMTIPRARTCIVDLHDNVPYLYECLTRSRVMERSSMSHPRPMLLMFKSTFHLEEYIRAVPEDERLPTRVIPNGVRLDVFKPNPGIQRQPFKFVYASCYSRGLLEILTKIWPIIVREEPLAELHLYYGLPTGEPDHPIHARFRDAMGRVYNVMDHGARPVDVIYRAKCEASFHLYTTETRSETDCISIKESIAVGCIPILYDTAVFKERDGFKIAYDNAGEKIVELMRDSERCESLRAAFYGSKTLVSWEDVSEDWLGALAVESVSTTFSRFLDFVCI